MSNEIRVGDEVVAFKRGRSVFETCLVLAIEDEVVYTSDGEEWFEETLQNTKNPLAFIERK